VLASSCALEERDEADADKVAKPDFTTAGVAVGKVAPGVAVAVAELLGIAAVAALSLRTAVSASGPNVTAAEATAASAEMAESATLVAECGAEATAAKAASSARRLLFSASRRSRSAEIVAMAE
jgi:hypothetical protein